MGNYKPLISPLGKCVIKTRQQKHKTGDLTRCLISPAAMRSSNEILMQIAGVVSGAGRWSRGLEAVLLHKSLGLQFGAQVGWLSPGGNFYLWSGDLRRAGAWSGGRGAGQQGVKHRVQGPATKPH